MSMKKVFRKLRNIRVSELVVIVLIIIPFVCYAAQTNVNLSVTVAPPQAPEVTTITVYQSQHAISIQGETVYLDQLIYIEDMSIGETLELQTDDQGNFIAVLDDSSRFAQVGRHQIIAITEIDQEDCSHMESEEIVYNIDQDYQVTIDTSGDQQVELLTDDISRNELEDLQRSYPSKDTSTKFEHTSCCIAVLGLEQEAQRLIVWQWVVIVFAGLSIIFLLIKRWRRKKKQGKSFWDLGNGIYCHHDQPK